jgi:Na+/melibiose symporter-like transporter
VSSGLGPAFWRMYAATASSDLADGIGRAALPLAATSYTRDPFLVSGLVTFAFLPWLVLALPSGALVDRVDRRRAMAVANLVRALVVAALAAVLLGGHGNVALLYIVAFILGAAETVYDCAVRALLPQVVRPDQLDRANSLITVEETLGQTFLGAPLGSVLFAVAIAAPFVLNAVGFVIAVLLILTVRGSYRPSRSATTTLRTDIGEGVRWLRRHPLLRGMTLISAGSAFAQSLVTGVFVLYVLEVLRLPSGDFGLVLLVAGVGGLIGGLATPPLARAIGRPVMLTAGATLAAVATGLMAFTRNGYVASGLFALAESGVMVWNVLTMSMRQVLIPQELFGRVQGAYRTVVWGAIPLGSLAGGALAATVDVRAVFAVSGVLLLLLAVALGRLVYRHAAEVSNGPRSAELVLA